MMSLAARVLRWPRVGGMLSFMSEVTRILSAIEEGDPHAVGQLLPLVYDELRRLAAQGRYSGTCLVLFEKWSMSPGTPRNLALEADRPVVERRFARDETVLVTFVCKDGDLKHGVTKRSRSVARGEGGEGVR
jgi:hypothetical protein